MQSNSCVGSILITGATSGIGFATLKEFHNKGYFVYFTFCSSADRAVEIEKEFPNTKSFQLDLSSNINIRSFFKEFDKLNIQLDALINNAAQTKFISQEEQDFFNEDVLVNFSSPNSTGILKFDLYIHDSWDGSSNNNEDYLMVYLDDF